MKIVRRKLWSRFWGLVALVAVVSCATALALAYEPNVVRGVKVLGSFLERIPVVYKAPRKPAPAKLAPVAPPPVPAEPVPAPQLAEGPAEEPEETPTEVVPAAPAVAAPPAVVSPKAAVDEAESEAEEWDEADELHSGEDEMPGSPDEAP
ncbi:MAG: hypothetical protein SF187_27170 [Deltaproteobacteria bacterium]|nr:hypothetical protein [Deltaproteobacteria bacterium]